jgi:hypothetical protein
LMFEQEIDANTRIVQYAAYRRRYDISTSRNAKTIAGPDADLDDGIRSTASLVALPRSARNGFRRTTLRCTRGYIQKVYGVDGG